MYIVGLLFSLIKGLTNTVIIIQYTIVANVFLPLTSNVRKR